MDNEKSNSPELVSGLPRCALIGLGHGGGAAADYVVKHVSPVNLQVFKADTAVVTLAAGTGIRGLMFGQDATGGDGCGGDSDLARAALLADQARFREALASCRLLVLTAALGGGTGTGALLPLVELAASMELPVVVVASVPYAFEGDQRARLPEADVQRMQALARAVVMLPGDALLATMPAVPSSEIAFGRLAAWLGEVAAAILHPFINPLPDLALAPPATDGAPAAAKGAARAQEQLLFSFSELSLGIFSATEPTRYNGQNLDVPTFQRRGIAVDRGEGTE